MDKIVHFCMFAPYPELAFQTFHVKDGIWRELALLAVLAVTGLAVALGTEQLQGMTGYRSYEIADFYADSIGLATGAALILIRIAFRKR